MRNPKQNNQPTQSQKEVVIEAMRDEMRLVEIKMSKLNDRRFVIFEAMNRIGEEEG